jgi:hypothetical protein
VTRAFALAALLLLAGCGGGGGGAPAGPGGPTGPTGPTGPGAWWTPASGLTWDWQLSDPLDLTRAVAAYDLDWETAPATVAALQARGVKVICYVSVGTLEPGRPDAASYPAAVVGAYWAEWGEYYVDVRAPALRAVVQRRLDACRDAGFDALEPDNMDSFEAGAATGFPLTQADGLDYARWLAAEAHARGLAIVQKNASSITAGLAALYDGALTEDCFAAGWCAEVAAYPAAGKPVLMAEYDDTGVDFPAACAWGQPRGYSPILKDRGLTKAFTACP